MLKRILTTGMNEVTSSQKKPVYMTQNTTIRQSSPSFTDIIAQLQTCYVRIILSPHFAQKYSGMFIG